MYNECRHILTSGHKCKAAALRGQGFCYFHNAARRYANIRTTSVDPILLPSTEDVAGVRIAVNQVLRALASKRIDPRQAGVFFYGLQIAERLATKSDEKPSETIREVSEDAEGSTLAPEKSTCEPPADCVQCQRRSYCQNFKYYKFKVEDLEASIYAELQAIAAENQKRPQAKVESASDT